MKQMKFADFLAHYDEDWRLIDVREKDEWDAARVKFAEHFPLSRIRHGYLPDEDDRKVAIICAAGGRSALAGQLFEQNGWGETVNISDGTNGAIATQPDQIERG